MPQAPSATELPISAEMLEEARTFNKALEELLAQGPPVHTVPPEETRRARAEGRGFYPPPEVLPQGQDWVIESRSGDLALRVFVPDDVRGVYLHIHGGGWVLGTAAGQDVALWNLAQSTRLAVVSVEYRLAPEHPWPAGPDDCEDAATWLVEHAKDRFGTDRLLIGGESAGAHLAAVTLLRLRDHHGAAGAFSAANLVYGVYDLTMTPSQRLWGERNLVLSTPIMAWFYDCFLPDMSDEERRRAEVSPLYADLSGLPSALFTVGALDPLLDDTLFMEARWRAAGNEAELHLFPEAVHGFNGLPLGLGRLTNRLQAEWLAERAKG